MSSKSDCSVYLYDLSSYYFYSCNEISFTRSSKLFSSIAQFLSSSSLIQVFQSSKALSAVVLHILVQSWYYMSITTSPLVLSCVFEDLRVVPAVRMCSPRAMSWASLSSASSRKHSLLPSYYHFSKRKSSGCCYIGPTSSAIPYSTPFRALTARLSRSMMRNVSRIVLRTGFWCFFHTIAGTLWTKVEMHFWNKSSFFPCFTPFASCSCTGWIRRSFTSPWRQNVLRRWLSCSDLSCSHVMVILDAPSIRSRYVRPGPAEGRWWGTGERRYVY